MIYRDPTTHLLFDIRHMNSDRLMNFFNLQVFFFSIEFAKEFAGVEDIGLYLSVGASAFCAWLNWFHICDCRRQLS